MVINHLEKLFITNDSATIVAELEVQHPAAKLLVMASTMLEAEVGDGNELRRSMSSPASSFSSPRICCGRGCT